MSQSTFTSLFTSESVGSGHPDKAADLLSDTLLDAYLAQDPDSRIAIEKLVKDGTVFLGGEVTSQGRIAPARLVQAAVRKLGYSAPFCASHADGLRVIDLIGAQSPDIARGVGSGLEQGAGDQGHVFGFARTETRELARKWLGVRSSEQAPEGPVYTDDLLEKLIASTPNGVAVEHAGRGCVAYLKQRHSEADGHDPEIWAHAWNYGFFMAGGERGLLPPRRTLPQPGALEAARSS